MTVLHGDCLDVMPTLDASSVDAIVTDPPYGLSFMGKDWDHGVPGSHFWTEALRVVKPGAHLLAFGGTRTYHRLTVAIEDAGWEIRDCLSWLYGSGFPKSHDVSKALDKAAGAVRERRRDVRSGVTQSVYAQDAWTKANKDSVLDGTPLTEVAREWNGWGTALKPAWEPIVLARKPLTGTVAANVQEHGTGALNLDGCRIGHDTIQKAAGSPGFGADREDGYELGTGAEFREGGRWPANVALDEEAAAMLDEQSGDRKAGNFPAHLTGRSMFGLDGHKQAERNMGDTGGASRFFYTAKASRAERNAGLDHMPPKLDGMRSRPGLDEGKNPRTGERTGKKMEARANHHPTVKPLDLMQWLCRLVTPKGGLILDPFCGSGTTGRAAVAEGFHFIGIEKEAEYVEIARARIAEYAPLFDQAAND